MARTITFTKLWGAPARQMSRLREPEYVAEMSTRLINRVWKYDWRETLNSIPPFYLLGDKQDYGKPIYAVPTDFLGLRKGTLTRLSDTTSDTTSPAPFVFPPMRVVARQPASRQYGIPNTLSFEPSIGAFRVFPILAPSAPTNEYFVSGVYKKLPQSNLYDSTTIVGAPILASEITGANYTNTLLPLDDRHYDLMCEVALNLARKMDAAPPDAYKIDSYIDGLLNDAAREEGVEIGASPVAPQEALMDLSNTGLGTAQSLYGW